MRMRRTLENAKEFASRHGGGKSRRNRFGGRLCNRCEHQTSVWKMRLHVYQCWATEGE